MALPTLGTAFDGPKTMVDLIDLGTQDPRAAGIWSPDYHESVVTSYIHQQFLDDADHYIEKYTAYDQWFRILSIAQKVLAFPTEARLKILDLGSGAGNTFFPLLDLFPNSTIVASDLSVPLLRALRRKQVEDYSQRDCWVMQLNAEELVFENGQFDLVVGGAILHHLFDPEKSIREASRVLKPGGFALFFEPFEMGQQILSMAMKHMKAINKYHVAGRTRTVIPDAAINLFDRICIDLEARKGSDKSAPIYRQLDDKWLFTKSYLQAVASRCGFRDFAVYPLYGIDQLFSNQVRAYLRFSGLDLESLPQWAQQYLAELDNHFSPDARQDMILEGGIVMRK